MLETSEHLYEDTQANTHFYTVEDLQYYILRRHYYTCYYIQTLRFYCVKEHESHVEITTLNIVFINHIDILLHLLHSKIHISLFVLDYFVV